MPLIAGGVAFALALTIGAIGVRGRIWQEAAPTEGRVTVSAAKLSGKTNEERIAFLATHGWSVSSEQIEILEVIIPEKFDEIYTTYNEMQIAQGFDLSNVAGRRCKRYSYRVENYPNTEEPVRAHVLVYKDKIIGGDVTSEIAGGFMHGLTMPQAQTVE